MIYPFYCIYGLYYIHVSVFMYVHTYYIRVCVRARVFTFIDERESLKMVWSCANESE